MKRLLILSMILILSLGLASAQEYNLVVSKLNGDKTTFRVEDVKNVTHGEPADPNEGWTSLGFCHYGEDFVGSAMYRYSSGDLQTDYYVEVQEKDDQPGLYRLVNPYSPSVYPYASYITYEEDKNYYIEINACDPNGVYIEMQDTGMLWGGIGRIWVYSHAAYYLDNGYPLSYAKNLGVCGTLKDGKITFPTDELITYLVAYLPDEYSEGNRHDNFYVDFNDKIDGGEDDSEEEDILEMFVEDTDGNITTFNVDDVESLAIVDVTDPNEGWTSLGYCLYGEDYIGSFSYTSVPGDRCCEYYVEVQECDTLPGLYRMVNPYGPDYPYSSYGAYDTGNFYVEINATDPDGVYIDLQDTGFSWGGRGRFYVYSYAKYVYDLGVEDWNFIKAYGLCGKLKDGVITFPDWYLVMWFPTYSDSYMYANISGKFKLDFNDRLASPTHKDAKQKTVKEDPIKINNMLTPSEVTMPEDLKK